MASPSVITCDDFESASHVSTYVNFSCAGRSVQNVRRASGSAVRQAQSKPAGLVTTKTGKANRPVSPFVNGGAVCFIKIYQKLFPLS